MTQWARAPQQRSLKEALVVRLGCCWRVEKRWLAEGRTIDHTTLSEFRRRHSAVPAARAGGGCKPNGIGRSMRSTSCG
jgi:hypothetical protein